MKLWKLKLKLADKWLSQYGGYSGPWRRVWKDKMGLPSKWLDKKVQKYRQSWMWGTVKSYPGDL